MTSRTTTTGIILTGGKGSRIGADKGLLLWKGKPFVTHIAYALKPLVSDLVMVGDNKAYQAFGYRTVGDAIKNAGPLSGLYSGLAQSQTMLNLVVSCDTPLMTSKTLEALLQKHKPLDNATVCRVEKQVMPLVGVYHKNCESACLELLKKNQLAMMRLLETLPKVVYYDVPLSAQKTLVNINTEEDLNQLQYEN